MSDVVMERVLSDAKPLLGRVVSLAHPPPGRVERRWVSVQRAFGFGSTYSIELCRRYGIDPYENQGEPLELGDECPTCGQDVEL